MRHKPFILTIFLSLFSSLLCAHGLNDIPLFESASINGFVEVSASNKPEFTYHYKITNDATNTGKIWSIDFDISTHTAHYTAESFPSLSTAPTVTETSFDMIEEALSLSPYIGKFGSAVVPVGQRTPKGWVGGYARDATVGFTGLTPEAKILPGESLTGFEMVSKHPPSLRDVTLVALWFHESDSDEPSDAEWALVAQATEATRIHTVTIAPSRESNLGSYQHWNIFSADVAQMITLNWITDTALSNVITQRIHNARQALDKQDGTLAKQLLRPLLNDINNAASTSLKPEAKNLLLININVLLDTTMDTPIPFEPVFTIKPEEVIQSVEKPYEVVIKIVNAADNNKPVERFQFNINCSFTSSTGIAESCIKLGFDYRSVIFESDSSGEIKLLIKRPAIGKAIFSIAIYGGEEIIGQASVIWKGGPDLVVPIFIPPLIQASGGDSIELSAMTMNQGNQAAGASTTKYYLSETKPIDIDTAYVVGQYQINSLNPDEQAHIYRTSFTIPANLPLGIYYLKACADANNMVVETEERNNCSDSELATIRVEVVPIMRNEETARASISDVSIEEGDFGESTFLFDVSLDRTDLLENITLNWNTIDGKASASEDYEPASGLLTFAPNSTELTQTVSITVYGDQLVEADETFSVILSEPSQYVTIQKNQGTGVIINDDTNISTLDCSKAYASPSIIWPPNHKFRAIHIDGILNTTDNNLNIIVNNIFQDEPVNDLGDGNAEPDASGIGTTQPKVRSERSGLKDGRIYEIFFTATSDSGDFCSGTVIVGIPHNKKDQPIDSIERYDSLKGAKP